MSANTYEQFGQKIKTTINSVNYVTRVVPDHYISQLPQLFTESRIIPGETLTLRNVADNGHVLEFRSDARISEDKLMKKYGGIPVRSLDIKSYCEGANNWGVIIVIGHKKFIAKFVSYAFIRDYSIAIDQGATLLLKKRGNHADITLGRMDSDYQEKYNQLLAEVRSQMTDRVFAAIREGDITYLDAANEGEFFTACYTDNLLATCMSIAKRYDQPDVVKWLKNKETPSE